MKRVALILLAIVALTVPILVIGQSKATRDSSATRQEAGAQDKAKKLDERARLAAEKESLKAARERARAARRAHAKALVDRDNDDEDEWDNLDEDDWAEVEPVIAEAWEGAEAAMEAASEAMENIDWDAMNESMRHAAALMADMPPLPDMLPMPDMPPFPDIPPIAAIPPIPAIPPMPPFAIAGGRSWRLGHREYTKNLSEDEQIRMQALAALLDNDEKTALPEIKTVARQSDNWAMRAYAVSMLANAESADVVSILEEVLNKDTDQRVRKAAVRALSQRDEPAAREALKRLLLK